MMIFIVAMLGASVGCTLKKDLETVWNCREIKELVSRDTVSFSICHCSQKYSCNNKMVIESLEPQQITLLNKTKNILYFCSQKLNQL